MTIKSIPLRKDIIRKKMDEFTNLIYTYQVVAH